MTKASNKNVKKKFFPVSIPILNKETELYGSDIKEFEGKYIKYDLTNILKGKAVELKLMVILDKKELAATPKEIKIFSSYLRRAARKGTDYAEDSFFAQCSDHRVKVKPFMVTRKRVPEKTLKGLRQTAKKEITEYFKEKTFEKIVSDIISNKIQKELGIKLKKVYPLSAFEIKFLGINDLKEYEKIEQLKKEEKNPQIKKSEEEIIPEI